MKKVVSVVGKPIRAIGRMLLKLLGKLRFLGALSTPLVKPNRLRDKDYQTLCDDLYASKLLQDLRAAGLPCEVALRPKLEELRNPELQVLSVKIDGDKASARARSSAVGEPTSVDTIGLVR